MKNPKLKNKRVFSHQKLIAGVPDKIFISVGIIALFALGIFVKLMGWLGIIAGIIFIFLIYMPLITIHANDANAWKLWVATFNGSTRLSTKQTTHKLILIIKGSRTLTFSRVKKELQK